MRAPRPTSRLGRAELARSRSRERAASPACAHCAENAEAARTYRIQLGKHECDREQKVRQEMDELRKGLEYEVHTLKEELRRRKSDAITAQAAAATALAGKAAADLRATNALADSVALKVMVREMKDSERWLGIRNRMVDRRDGQIEFLTTELAKSKEAMAIAHGAVVKDLQTEKEAVEKSLNEMSELAVSRLSMIRKACGKMGGARVLQRTDLELEGVTADAKSHWVNDSTKRVVDLIGVAGTKTEMSLEVIMNALVTGGYLLKVFGSEEMWELREEWARLLRGDLAAVWDARLTMRLKDKILISQSGLDELRYAFSHHRVGKKLHPRPWIINPHTNKRVYFPEPIAPRSKWTPLVTQFIQQHGLVRDTSGKIAQRSYVGVLRNQVRRDVSRDWMDLDSITEEAPLQPTLGADGTIVGKMGFMHVTSDISINYKIGIAQQNELNVCTLACSQGDDHWGGLNDVLCGGFYTGTVDHLPPDSIAADFNAMISNQRLDVDEKKIPCNPIGCFDLAAARGLRGGRGRCACHCSCLTAAERHAIPSCLDADDTSKVEWAEVKKELEDHTLLDYDTMLNDSHTPPDDWDFAKSPWVCKRDLCGVTFKSKEEYHVQRAIVFIERKDKSDTGKKAAALRGTRHLKFHPSNQAEFNPPLTLLDMLRVIIDPLHAGLLNLPKTIWKYAFGDRMTNEQRELLAEYLISIDCPLDVRAKGDGRDANRKWFMGDVFIRFVEGEPNTNNPGLIGNINAILDIL